MSSENIPLPSTVLPPLCSLNFESEAYQTATHSITMTNYSFYSNHPSAYTPTVPNKSPITDQVASSGETSHGTNLVTSAPFSHTQLPGDSYQSTSTQEVDVDRYHSPSSPTDNASAQHILAEKRRRNAGASARFRDRRKQREREILERCVLLEDRVKELEHANPFTQQMAELSNELKHAQLEKANALEKLKVLENEVAWLRELIVSKGETLPPFTDPKY